MKLLIKSFGDKIFMCMALGRKKLERTRHFVRKLTDHRWYQDQNRRGESANFQSCYLYIYMPLSQREARTREKL